MIIHKVYKNASLKSTIGVAFKEMTRLPQRLPVVNEPDGGKISQLMVHVSFPSGCEKHHH